ncbi:hypothetical protein CYY_007206 [Polysphondylium violaceum]|uniref:UNC93-like protein MFSD11 n=1 Tax=Polysphondylium violaceum TaxID=133409 RepID=A0A8J4PP01_9MYCE|nr:hypothetical protein CYY_007206 [Polysphondylium violaceum]
MISEINEGSPIQQYDNEKVPLIKPQVLSLRNKSIYNVLVLGISFCVLFTAFSPTQNLETTLNADLGFLSLSILYGFLSFSNFFSPMVVLKAGEKISLIIGTLAYVLYIAANIKVTPETLCIASGILGIGGAILWTAQGSFVIRCSTEKTLGLHTGIFFALFQVNQIIGNLGTGVLLNHGLNLSILFIILSAVCASSIFGFLLLGNPIKVDENGVPLVLEKQDDIPMKQRLMATVNILKERPIQLLIPALFYSGISQSFFFGVFPPLTGKMYLGYIMAVFGVCDALGSVGIGKASDVIGRKPLIIFSTVCCIGGSIFAYFISTRIEHNQIGYYFICAGLLGFADAGFNTLLYSLLGALYPKKGEAAVAVFKFVQSIASAIAFFYGHYVVLYKHVIILNSLVVPACILFLIVDARPKSKISVESIN